MEHIKQKLGQTPAGETRWAFGFSGDFMSLENLEISMVNHGLIQSSMLNLGNPEGFRYIISTANAVERYFSRAERALILEKNLPPEMGTWLTGEWLRKFAAGKMAKFTEEVFLRYGQESMEEVSN